MHFLKSHLCGFLLALLLVSHLPSFDATWTDRLFVGSISFLGALLAGLSIFPVSAAKVLGCTLGILWGLLHGAHPPKNSYVDKVFQVYSKSSWQLWQGPFLAKPYISQGTKVWSSQPSPPNLQLYGSHPIGTLGFLSYSKKSMDQSLWTPNASRQYLLVDQNKKYIGPFIPEIGFIHGSISALKESLKIRLQMICQQSIPRSKQMVSSWLIGIYLGDQHEIPETVKESFKRVGLYHLLSVGGLHVTVLTALGTLLIRAPLIGIYGSARILKPYHMGFLLQILNMICIAFALLYLLLSGATPGVQRSVFLYIFTLLGLLFWGQKPLSQKMIWGIFMQSLVFPIGFLSEAAVMSWVCYLRVSYLLEGPSGIRQKLLETLKIQFELAIMSGAFFGQFSFMGLVANGCLIGVFTAIFVISVVCLLPQIAHLDSFVVHLHKAFLDLVCYLADLSSRISLSYLELKDLDWKVRGLFVFLSGYFVLNNIKKIAKQTWPLDHES